jgi:hypothetical protein
MTEAQQLFMQKHEAFHARRVLLEAERKSMTKEDWIILRLLKASCRTQATTNPDYVRSIMYMLKKHGSKALDGYISQLLAGGKP